MQTLERFLTAKIAAGLSPQTVRWYKMFVSGYVSWCEQTGQERAKPDTVDSYLARLRNEGLSTYTVSGCYRALRAYFAWLVKRGELSDSPIAQVQKPRRVILRMRYVTPEYFKRLYRSINGEHWMDYRDRAALLVMFYSGLRAAELIDMHTNDIDRDQRLLVVNAGKGQKARIVPYHQTLEEQIDSYQATHPPHRSKKLWFSSDGYDGIRGPMTVYALRGLLERRSAAAGLEYYNPHSFRHGFAMMLLNHGMSLSAVGAAMGHSSTAVTEQFYAHWVANGLRREYDDALRRITVSI